MRVNSNVATPRKPMFDRASLTILNSLTSGIFALDLEGRILFVNTTLCDSLGIDRKAWLGKSAQEFVGIVASHLSPRRVLLHDPSSMGDLRPRSREVEWSDGKRVAHLREDSGPLRDESGQVVGQWFAYHDLSWEKMIDQMKSDFISIASHELRTPMTSIKGSVDLILAGCAGEVSADALDLLKVAQSACDRMVRLINDILDLSKIEAGRMKLKLAPIDLAETVEHSLNGLKSLAALDGITLALECPPNIPPVMADRDRIEQVVTNLVSNAIKFSPANAEVRIELSAEDGWVRCAVADKGCGIKEEDVDRIFGKFQQVGTPQRGGGTGLGLAITHALVTEHKGKIWVESRVAEGSRFIFSLPVTTAPAAS
jgi:PAS domain S-box-containing protein